MALPQSFLDELIYRSDIVEIVSRYVPLKKAGANYVGLCPFHNEKTPSFSVSREKQFFKCFGCGEGGNVISFVMKIENLPFLDAVQQLASIAGMTVPEDDSLDEKHRRERARLLALNKDAARYFHDVLVSPAGRPALEYLLRRGMSPKIINTFGLGYADSSWDGLIRAMLEKGYSRSELETARLASRGKNGGLYCFFRERVIFPIIDIRGNVVAFGGRVIQGDGGGRKYINSSDTPVYNKSRMLYGMNLAKKSKSNKFILCEGNIDVISLHQAGFDSAVASCGTAFTAEQAKLLSRYTQEVVICYDADAAGQKATQKAIDILNKAAMKVRVLKLPSKIDRETGKRIKMDPDDYIKEYGADAFAKLLDNPQTDGQYRLGEIRARYDLENEEQRISFLKEAARYIATLGSAVEREIFARNAAREAGISEESMMTEVARARKMRQRRAEAAVQKEALTPKKRMQPQERELRYDDPASAMCEEKLLAIVLNDTHLLQFAGEKLRPEEFSSPFLAKLYEKSLRRLQDGLDIVPAAFMSELTEAENRHFAAILAGHIPSRDSEKEVADYIQKIRYQYKKRMNDGDDLLRFAAERKR